MSIAKSRRRDFLRRLSVSRNLSCYSEEHPQGYLLRGAKRRGNPQSFSCKFAEERKNCAIWEQIATPVCGLARNDRLFRQPCLSLWERWPSAARTERANKKEPPSGGSFPLVDKPSLWGQRFIYAGGARGGKARLELNQMSRKALPCKACVEHPKGTCFAARSDYFRAARRYKNNDIISGCRKSQRLFRQPGAPA